MNRSKHNEVLQRTGNPMASTLIYQHMSSHYRRILNAKPIVDSSSPQNFKSRAPRTAKSPFRIHKSNLSGGSGSLCSSQESFYMTSSENEIIDKIVACDKFSPAVVCGMKWSSTQRNHLLSEKNTIHLSSKMNSPAMRHSKQSIRPNPRPRLPGDLLERHKDQFEAIDSQFWPRILKSEVDSKLRHMRVYHPPKRKTPCKNADWDKRRAENVEQQQCKCRGVCTCSQVGNQASSRDSAYNGGTASTPESRSPTPCQRKQRGTNTDSVGQCNNHIATQTDIIGTWNSSSLRKSEKRNSGEDGIEYTKLIHDITQEVVNNGTFSDKSVARIIKKHIAANVNVLNKERMLSEVSKLKTQLGILDTEDDLSDSLSRDRSPSYQLSVKSKPVESDISPSELDSWTTVYSHLLKEKLPDKTEIGASIEIVAPNSYVMFADDETKPQDEDSKDSDSSTELTIKEVSRKEDSVNVRETPEIVSDLDSSDESSEVSEF